MGRASSAAGGRHGEAVATTQRPPPFSPVHQPLGQQAALPHDVVRADRGFEVRRVAEHFPRGHERGAHARCAVVPLHKHVLRLVVVLGLLSAPQPRGSTQGTEIPNSKLTKSSIILQPTRSMTNHTASQLRRYDTSTGWLSWPTNACPSRQHGSYSLTRMMEFCHKTISQKLTSS